MAEKNEMLKDLFNGLDGFMSSKTVVGDAITMPNGIVLIPLMDITFGVGGGAFSKEVKNKSCGALGGKMTPNSVIIINGEDIRLLNVKEQDALTKCIDLIPEIAKKIKKLKNGDELDQIVDEVAKEAVNAQANKTAE